MTMTPEKALEIIGFYVDNNDDMYTGYKENNEALKVAIKCIESQIKKEPEYFACWCGDDLIKQWSCAKCGDPIDPEYDYYCCGCGQKIKAVKDDDTMGNA